MCTVLLPPGGYPIAVNKYIIYHIYCLHGIFVDLYARQSNFFERLPFTVSHLTAAAHFTETQNKLQHVFQVAIQKLKD
jgi:hypothetical protein